MPTATSLLMSSITSSPIAPPTTRDTSTSTPIRNRTSSWELSSSPTAPGPVSRRKRPAEDHSQFAKVTSQRYKLRKTDTAELQNFANVSCPPVIHSEPISNLFAQYGLVQQNIIIAAGMFKIREQLEGLNPPDVLYSIPKKIAVVDINLSLICV